jgi:uncharacterized membrane protein
MGLNGNLYKFLLLLHIACAVLGFGATAFNGLYLARARRYGGTEGAAILETNADASRIAEFFIYAVFILGVLVVSTSKSAWKFSQGWLSAAIVIYLIDVAVLHGVVRRSQKRHDELAADLAAAPKTTDGRPSQVGELERLEQRIQVGWSIFNVLFLIVIYLMVFKPGL